MQPFRSIKSPIVPLPESNIDTDQIIPARFLHKQRSENLGIYLFRDLRENPVFVLNQRQGQILVAGDNFGCGSSRENAVWALHDYGFRVVIAPSFGDIFFNNSLKNGLLPVRLPVEELLTAGSAVVDLESQTVTADGCQYSFDIDPFAKHCILNGIDELGYTLSRLDEIVQFEKQYEP
jgi:3-isopropylmalate/(R)-2-methylmalate dehydratase small subunit